MPVKGSSNRDIRWLATKAKFENEDEQDRRIVARQMADPSILGLRQADAEAIASTLSDVMYKVIVGEDRFEDLDDEPKSDGSEGPVGEADDVDLEDDDDDDDVVVEEEDAPHGISDEEEVVEDEGPSGGFPFDKPKEIFPKDDAIVPEGGDIGEPGMDLGRLLDLDRDPVGFPDEDEEDEDLLGLHGEEGGLGEEDDHDGIGIEHELGASPFANEGGPIGDDFGGEESAVSLQGPGDGLSISLPGGQTLEMELKPKAKAPKLPQDIDGPAKPQEVPMMEQERNASQDPQMTAFLNQRKAARNEMLRQAQEQQAPEHIDPSTEKALGEDTSFGGSKFVMEDGQTSVGIPEQPDEHTLMTMTNSEGNSLRSWNADFSPQRVPTKDPGNMMNMGGLREQMSLTDEKSGVFTNTLKDTELKVPTQGNTDNLWGAKDFGEMQVPSQDPKNTGERKHTRAGVEPEGLQVFASPEWQARVAKACSESDCMGGHKVSGTVDPVKCVECGIVYAMCEGCQEQNYCPTCGLPEGLEAQAQINTDLYCGTPKDKAELCLDDRGDDVNGDGGFRSTDKTGGSPKKQDARNMQLDAGEYEAREAAYKAEIKQVMAKNERLQVEMARLAKAAEVTLQMVDNGQVLASEGISKIDQFFSSEMDVPALESLREIAAGLPRQQHQERLADVQVGMSRSASLLPIQPSGLGYNPNPSMGSVGNEDLQSVLAEVLSSNMYKDADFDPETGRKLSRR